tara:strand:- start:1048 stop:1290 length:243 start_codon:yes stop_codon:yes gene_type:complete
MDYWKKKRIEEDAQWEQWSEKMKSLSWNDSDRSQILFLLLDTEKSSFVSAIEAILLGKYREEMKELIETVENRRNSIVNG